MAYACLSDVNVQDNFEFASNARPNFNKKKAICGVLDSCRKVPAESALDLGSAG